MTTRVYTGVLTTTSCWCGIGIAIPESLYNEASYSGKTLWCPLGHQFVFKGSEKDRLERELRIAKNREAGLLARAEGAENSLRTTKGHVTRLRTRVLAGECPICGHHLRDLERHVSRVHKDEPVELPDQ